MGFENKSIFLPVNCKEVTDKLITLEPDETYKNTLMALLIINGILSLFVTFSNTVVICTISKISSLHTPSNFLILGQAVFDLFVGVVVQPSFCFMQYYEVNKVYEYYCPSWMVYNVFGWGICTASFFSLSALIADRYVALNYHLRYQELVTNKRIFFLVLSIWFFGICCGILRALTELFFLFVIISIIFVLALNVFLLTRIYLIIRRHSTQIHALQNALSLDSKTKKSANAMFYMFAAVVISYVPELGALIVPAIIGISTYTRIAWRTGESFAMLSSLLNPIIYFWRIKELRKASKTLVCKAFNGHLSTGQTRDNVRE